jgi:hypothetical protein
MQKYIDITGQKNGMLTVTERYWDEVKKTHLWKANCECGGIRQRIDVTAWRLKRFSSCGCIRTPDLQPGEQFNKWTVICKDIADRPRYACKCECGNAGWVSKTDLTQGRSKGCQECGHAGRKKPADLEKCKERLRKRYRDRALREGYTWEIEEIFFMLTDQLCKYCGKVPSSAESSYGATYWYNGIDRVDNSRGYELHNVVPCCGTCNKAKSGMPVDQFESWLDQIAMHRGSYKL